MKYVLLYIVLSLSSTNAIAQRMPFDTTGLAELYKSRSVWCGNAVEIQNVNDDIIRAQVLLNSAQVDAAIALLLPDCFNNITGDFYREISPTLKNAFFRKYTKDQIKNEVINAVNTIARLKESDYRGKYKMTIFNVVIYFYGFSGFSYYYMKYGEEKFMHDMQDDSLRFEIVDMEIPIDEELIMAKKYYTSSSFYKDLSVIE